MLNNSFSEIVGCMGVDTSIGQFSVIYTEDVANMGLALLNRPSLTPLSTLLGYMS